MGSPENRFNRSERSAPGFGSYKSFLSAFRSHPQRISAIILVRQYMISPGMGACAVPGKRL